MSKTTITLHDYLTSEFSKGGRNEVYDYYNLNNPAEDFGMLWDDVGESYMDKILTYDTDTSDIINRKIFRGLSLVDKEADEDYKRMFIFRYMNQQIGFQTIEEFSARVMYIFLGHKKYLDYYNTNLDDMLKGKSESNATSSSKGTSEDISTGSNTTKSNSRDANVTLPQDQPSLNLDNNTILYADDTQASLGRTEGSNNSKSTAESLSTSSDDSVSVTHSLDELQKVRNTMRELIAEYEKECFLLTW